MSKTVEELLNQRVIVELPVPFQKSYEVGMIFNSDNGFYYHPQGKAFLIPEEEVLRCPKTFRPLAWYEKRDVSDMPEYVKYVYNGETTACTKAIGWDHNYAIFEYYDNGKPKRAAMLSDTNLLPATLSDYEQFTSKK